MVNREKLTVQWNRDKTENDARDERQKASAEKAESTKGNVKLLLFF